MTEKQTVKKFPLSVKFSIVLCVLIFISLGVLLSSALTGASAKTAAIATAGQSTADSAKVSAAALYEFEISNLKAYLKDPAAAINSKTYEKYSAYLTRMKTANNYVRVYLLSKADSNYIVLGDSEYSKTGIIDKDYMRAGSEFPLKTLSKEYKQAFEDIFSKKEYSKYTKNVITSDLKGRYLSAFAPVYDDTGAVIALIGIDTSANFLFEAGNKAIFFNQIALTAFYVFLIAVVLLIALWQARAYREKRKARKDAEAMSKITREEIKKSLEEPKE